MPFGDHEPIPKKEKISVSYLIERLQERVQMDLESFVAESETDQRYVTEAELHRPGLALAGYVKLFTHQRIQVIGNTETRYLKNLSKKEQKEAFENLTQFEIPVLILTHSNTLPDYLLAMAAEAGIPIYGTSLETTRFMHQ